MQINLPQLQIFIGNTQVYGAISLEVVQTGYFTADRFVLLLGTGISPLSDISYFASLSAEVISISVATVSSDYKKLITGQIDNVKINLSEKIVTISGRDLSARLIDSEMSETFINQTASQIATMLALRHDLSANVTATSVPVGQYYELDHARSALGLNSRTSNEWNMLCFLAEEENYNLSVVDTTLNFGPALITQPFFLAPSNCIELSLDSSTVIPKNVIVKSWNTRQKTAISESAGAITVNSTTLIRPNLTAKQAANMAANHLAKLAGHIKILTASIPGETALTPSSQLLLYGTNSAFDLIYIIDSIVRFIDTREGFIETIHAHTMVN